MQKNIQLLALGLLTLQMISPRAPAQDLGLRKGDTIRSLVGDSDRMVEGTLIGLLRDSMTVAPSTGGIPIRLALCDVSRMEVRRRASTLGVWMLVGVAAGGVLGGVVGYSAYDEVACFDRCRENCDPDSWCVCFFCDPAYGAFGGAVVGSGIGLLAGVIGHRSVTRWVEVPLGSRLTLAVGGGPQSLIGVRLPIGFRGSGS